MENNKEFDIIGCGEVMLRLSPLNKERISQCETFDKKAGGAELNVVSGMSSLGLRSAICTKLPDNEIGKFVKNKIRYSGTSDDFIVYDEKKEKRLGIYYYESGAYPRLPTVVYDRNASSFTTLKLEDMNPQMYKSAKYFHTCGITLALSEELRETVTEMIKSFKENGTVISFDVNYRATLWDEETAKATITKILPYVDVLFVSHETLSRMFAKTGTIEEMMLAFAKEFSNLKIIASTIRTVKTATRHSWESVIYDTVGNRYYREAPYEDIEVVDRIGSGDAFVAGVLFGLIKHGDIQSAAAFGNAMAAVKNTIPGDMTACDYSDILRVISAHKNGNASEMNR